MFNLQVVSSLQKRDSKAGKNHVSTQVLELQLLVDRNLIITAFIRVLNVSLRKTKTYTLIWWWSTYLSWFHIYAYSNERYRVIRVKVDPVSGNVSFLIALYILDKYKMYFNTVSYTLCGPNLNVEVPLTRNHVKPYFEGWNKEIILFTEKEVYKLDRNISQPD